MNVAIYGAGAMGTVLGAYISKAGYPIDLINRNKDHIEALKTKGAIITGTATFKQEVHALLPEEMTKKYDIILLMTKQRFNQQIVQELTNHLTKDGVICTLQNGIPEPAISDIIGPDKTIGCTMSWGATFHGHGIVELTTVPSKKTLTFQIGGFGLVDKKYINHIVTLLQTMGHVDVSDNLIGARWAKLMVNAAFSGLSLVTGATFGEIAKNKKSRVIALEIIKECIEVAKKSSIIIEPIQGKDIVKLMDYNSKIKKQLSLFLLPIAMRKHKAIRSSMLRDLARDKKTEIDSINGVIVSYAKKVNISTPLNSKIVSITKQLEAKEKTPSWSNLSLFNKTP